TGEDWSSAFGTLHEALDYALPGDEIWVAEGTYYPVTPADDANITQGEQEQSLSLKPGMILCGGFAGDEGSVSQRDPHQNQTIISGDIGVEDESSDNSIHLFRNEVDASQPLKRETIVDGFVLEEATGSAVSNVNASPSFRYSIFRNNEGENGAAVKNENSSPFFYNVLFYGNNATSDGGALYGDAKSNPELLNCTVADNSADAGGGLAGYFKVRNTIVFGNNGGQVKDSSDVAYSCIENGFDGEENISYAPDWQDAEDHDYQLNEFSPCIDQGDWTLISESFSFDLAQNTRQHNFHVDMGAYEAQSVGELEIVESPLIDDEPVDFIDSLIIRFNQPVDIDSDTIISLNPPADFTVRTSEEDSTVLIIDHPGLASSTDYQMEIPDNMIHHLKNERIAKQQETFDFTTRECVPVTLNPVQSELNVCPRTSAQVSFDIEGDLLDYEWVFNDQDTLEHSNDTLNIESVRSGDLGSYKLVADDWCENTISSTVELQFKETEELVIPEPKWNSVYFVDNSTGNFSDFTWYADGEVVSEKQYLKVDPENKDAFVVTALDSTSQCVVYSDTIRHSGDGLKSASINPNPVKSGDPVYVRLPGVSEESRILLYDMKGGLLVDKVFGEGGHLKLEQTRFKSGVYLIRIEYADGRVEERKLLIH
ncbi:MAG: T9SS type A sorting domain-containing protein, partial [Marinilabiliaceae bacterium]